MEINGIDVETLTPDDCSAFPELVPGRVLQLDGDVLVYQCSYDDNAELQMCINNYFSAVEFRRRIAGAEHVNIHLTHGDKGGRSSIATVKEYQGTRRKNRLKTTPPKNLKPLKDYLLGIGLGTIHVHESTNYITIIHEDQEADDGMAQGNYRAIQDGTPELSVIMSIDKDLCMCSGWHCQWDSFKMHQVDGFGSIELDRTKSTPKIKGYGTSFFWAQILMGDTADDIPGLPKLAGMMLIENDPTKKNTVDLEILETHTWESTKYKSAKKRLLSRKPKACGTVLTYKLLENCKSDLEAMHIIINAYRSWYSPQGKPFHYTSWDGFDKVTTSAGMILEQASLLWMRRVKEESPSIFFKDVLEGRKWDGQSI